MWSCANASRSSSASWRATDERREGPGDLGTWDDVQIGPSKDMCIASGTDLDTAYRSCDAMHVVGTDGRGARREKSVVSRRRKQIQKTTDRLRKA